MAFDYLGRIAALTPANLTIREQTRLADNPNDLRWRAIAPKAEAESVKLSELSTVDTRFAGGRREWNAQGREIPEVLGGLRDIEMVPVNPTHHIDERRLQHLRERTGGFAQLLQGGVVKDVDAWATALANAADIQIEADFFEAWFSNQITVMDPKTGTTVTAPLGIDAGRYVTASQTLAAATNGYDALMGYIADAYALLGSVGPVRANRALFQEAARDAPSLGGVRMSFDDLAARVSSEGYGQITLVPDDRTYHKFTDGGSAYTTAKYVPAGKLAIAPASGVVGATFFAPVARAYDYMDPAAVSTVQDFTVFYSEKNDGKTLMVEAQANALAVPAEANTYVVSGLA